jgi:hypothetical protein
LSPDDNDADRAPAAVGMNEMMTVPTQVKQTVKAIANRPRAERVPHLLLSRGGAEV